MINWIGRSFLSHKMGCGEGTNVNPNKQTKQAESLLLVWGRS